jgi:ribulose-bisphosphate carboxylase large chain
LDEWWPRRGHDHQAEVGLHPKPFGEAYYAFWPGGDFFKNDDPQYNQVSAK